MGVIQGAIRNRHAVAVLALGTVASWRGGGLADSGRHSAGVPSTSRPVDDLLLGHAREVVEKNITNRLGSWTGQASGTQLQESKSMVGVSVIRNYFSDSTDPNTALTQVNSLAMSNLRYLPPGTLPSIVMPFDPTATLPTCILSVASDQFGEGELQDIGRYELRSAIQAVPGAVAPAVFGGKARRSWPTSIATRSRPAACPPSRSSTRSGRATSCCQPEAPGIGDIDYQIESNSMYDSPRPMEKIPLEARSGNALPMWATSAKWRMLPGSRPASSASMASDRSMCPSIVSRAQHVERGRRRAVGSPFDAAAGAGRDRSSSGDGPVRLCATPSRPGA